MDFSFLLHYYTAEASNKEPDNELKRKWISGYQGKMPLKGGKITYYPHKSINLITNIEKITKNVDTSDLIG